MSKSTKILWIIDLMAVEKLLLRGGWLKNVEQEVISKFGNQKIRKWEVRSQHDEQVRATQAKGKLANQQIWKLENERSVRNYIFNEELLKSRN